MVIPIIGISTCFEKQGGHYYHQTGDKYIITAGAPTGISGTTNMIKIHAVE